MEGERDLGEKGKWGTLTLTTTTATINTRKHGVGGGVVVKNCYGFSRYRRGLMYR